jgi:uncharacterized protein
MQEKFYQKIHGDVIDRLSRGLPDYLTYHNVRHTLDVLEETLVIAHHEGIADKEDLLLLKLSALYHDTGFLISYAEHEEQSCILATEELSLYGISTRQIDIICGLIRATRIPQTAHTKLEEILCDADLDYLGRDDFFSIGDGLYHEFKHTGIVKDFHDWNALQVKFLNNHQYFTPSSKRRREQKKMENLESVKGLLV